MEATFRSAGFMAWAVTLPISGNSPRLANSRMLAALFVHEFAPTSVPCCC